MVQSLVPNLMVSNVASSARFYLEILGMPLQMAVVSGSQENVSELVEGKDLQFALLGSPNPVLMLQSQASLTEELPHFSQYVNKGGTFTLYFKVNDFEATYTKVPKEFILKDKHVTWYGANEFYMKDLDGYTLAISG
jgi:catechol 2,3-dioxygenase-like lactoylglutathione lyase family enzyme